MRAAKRITRVCLWAILWGVGIGLLKLLVFLFHGFNFSPAYLIGSIASFFGNILWGILIGFLLFSKSRLIQCFGYAVAFLIAVFYISCFHYELFFGALPGADLFYYLRELPHLLPSLKSNAPFGFLLFEVGYASILIFGGVFVVDRLGLKLQTSMPGFVFTAGILILSVCIPVFLHVFQSKFSNDAFYQGSRNPIFWLAHSSLISVSENHQSFTPLQIWEYQKALGHRVPSGGKNPNYPLCSNLRSTGSSSFDKRSVILIILESVGNKEVFMEIDQKPLMPNLVKIAKNGLFFENISASGTKSNQVLPAIFSGIPPQTYNNILWKKPLPKLDGLPALLREHGYQTAYFHGSDLSFEQQRSFLKMVGFEHLFDYDPKMEKKVSGWGYDDREMFSTLMNWITHSARPDDPYFATLFTLSTHDPFLLPPDWETSFTQNRAKLRENGTWIGVTPLKDRYDLYLESLHFLDHEIGKFYDWYLESEQSKGTLLVILSDHVTSLHNEAADID
ncbi:MAG: sulfatase-like hydrolase/transferase, partial [Desulfobacterales bacterium]|nr:sulfatase-like hydrolase/transferase [Desulfobacterales bacterium]